MPSEISTAETKWIGWLNSQGQLGRTRQNRSTLLRVPI